MSIEKMSLKEKLHHLLMGASTITSMSGSHAPQRVEGVSHYEALQASAQEDLAANPLVNIWGDKRFEDPTYLNRRLAHHKWRVEFGGPPAEDHAQTVLWLEKKLAAVLTYRKRELRCMTATQALQEARKVGKSKDAARKLAAVAWALIIANVVALLTGNPLAGVVLGLGGAGAAALALMAFTASRRWNAAARGWAARAQM